MMRGYMAWRKQNGYGRRIGRWGRSASGLLVPFVTNSLGKELNGVSSQRVRSKREALSSEFIELLREYRRWRQQFGYGAHGRRWGR